MNGRIKEEKMKFFKMNSGKFFKKNGTIYIPDLERFLSFK